MVLLWTKHEEDPKDNLSYNFSTPPHSLSFITPVKGTRTSPGSITNSSTPNWHPKVNNRPPRHPSGRCSLSPSTWSSSGESSAETPALGRMTVAVRDAGTTPRRINLSRTLSAYESKSSSLTSTPITHTKISLRNGFGRSSLREKFKPVVLDVAWNSVSTLKSVQVLKFTEKGDQDSNKSENIQEDVDGKRKPSTKKDKKRFYSLPRNWRGKAADLIWSKGNDLSGHRWTNYGRLLCGLFY